MGDAQLKRNVYKQRHTIHENIEQHLLKTYWPKRPTTTTPTTPTSATSTISKYDALSNILLTTKSLINQPIFNPSMVYIPRIHCYLVAFRWHMSGKAYV